MGACNDGDDAAVEILGYTRDELLSMGPQEIDAGLSAETINALIGSMEEDEIQVFETVHVTKKGEKIPVEISSSLITYQGKTAILSVARDISERKKAEQRFRKLFETSRDAIMILEPPEWEFTAANPAALEMFKAEDEE